MGNVPERSDLEGFLQSEVNDTVNTDSEKTRHHLQRHVFKKPIRA